MSYILDLYLLRDRTDFKVLKESLLRSEKVEEKIISSHFSADSREEIKSVLNDLRKKHHLKSVRVYLPFYMCLFNIIELPLRKKSEIDNALLFELGSILPLPVGEYIYSFRILSKTKSSSKVLSLCVKKDIIAGITDIIQASEMALKSVKCGFMEKLAVKHSGKKRDNYIFVNIESGDIDMAVVKGGVCETLKRMGDIDHLRSEIQKMQGQHDIKDVLITGDVTDSLRDELDISAVEKQKKEVRKIRFANPYTFEFFKPEEMEGYKEKFRLNALIAVSVSGVLIVMGYFLPIYRDYSRLKSIDGQIREIKDEASELIDKRRQLIVSREKLKFLKERQRSRELPLSIIGEVTGILPKDAWIMSLNIDEKGFIELRGFAENASGLVEILEKSDMFENVGFSAPILKSGDKTRFSIKMVLER